MIKLKNAFEAVFEINQVNESIAIPALF